MHQCRTCAADGECASTVCDTSTGSCVDGSSVLYASPTGAGSASCDITDPCSITQALAAAGPSRHVVKLAVGTYNASIAISGKTVDIHGDGATLQGISGQQGVKISDGANVVVEGLKIVELSNDIAFNCGISQSGAAMPVVTLDRVDVETEYLAISDNPCVLAITRSQVNVGLSSPQASIGVQAPGTVTVDRTIVNGGAELIAFDTGALMKITNSVIENQNGSDGALVSQLLGSAPGSITVSFSTILNSLVKCGTNPGTPPCMSGGDPGVCLDSTIVLNTGSGAPSDTITGPTCVANYVIAMPQSTALTGANNKLGVDPMLVDPASGDYHLKPNSPAVDAADPTATATPDLDGTPRPQGSRADIGAFEYKP